MARIENESSFLTPSLPEGDDFMEEVMKNISGCEMSNLLMDMLKTAITNQNPFNVALNSENEDKLLDLYGYQIVEFPVKQSNGEIEYFEGALKKGEKVPKRPMTMSQYTSYSKKAILDGESQKLMIKVMSWLISKFKDDDNN